LHLDEDDEYSGKIIYKEKDFGPIFSVSCTVNVKEIVFVV
jgi:hypothetical protein